MESRRARPPHRAVRGEDEEQTFVEHMLAQTVRVMRDAASFPEEIGVASGVIVQRQNELCVLTVGDIFRHPGSWTLEAKFRGHNESLYVPVRNVQSLASLDRTAGRAGVVDLAWASLDPAEIRDALAAHPTLTGQNAELPVYRGPLGGSPKVQAVYGYASWNRVDVRRSPGIRPEDASWETHMRFCGIRPHDHMFEFALAGSTQTDEFYHGASGAPIADENGEIVSLLLEVDRGRGRVVGLPLARFGAIIEGAPSMRGM